MASKQKFGLLSAFVNKVLLEHGHTCLFAYCLWLLLCYNTDHMSAESKVLTVWPFTEKICQQIEAMSTQDQWE